MSSYYDLPDESSPYESLLEEVENLLPEMREDAKEALFKLVTDLAYRADTECPACAKRFAEAEAEDARQAAQYQVEPLPQSEVCPHGASWLDCNACLVASDFAYDAARERTFC